MSDIDFVNEFRICSKNGIYYLQSSLFLSLNVNHFFSMRFGGVSEGDFSSLNVSNSRKNRFGFADSDENVFENYKRLFNAFDTDLSHVATARQVHGDNCIIVDDKCRGLNIPGFLKSSGEDGLILTSDNNSIDCVCVKTADCVPVLLFDSKGKNVACVHSGHRGTSLKIVSACVEAMKSISNCTNSDIYAAIGPCIGKCCYEVSSDVAESIRRVLGNNEQFELCCLDKYNSKFMLDLAFVNKLILMNSGVPKTNISVCPYKTCCFEFQSEKAFFSHRKSGGFSGTFASAIFRNKTVGL